MVNKDRSNQRTKNWPIWRIILMVLNIIAIVLCIILSWHYFKVGAMPGCGSGSSCDQVLSSRWSSIAGIIPVSGLALGAYLAMLIASLNISISNEFSIRRLSWNVMLVLSGIIIGNAVWFTILQKWIIGEFCIYCMSTHIIGTVLSAIIIWQTIKESNTAKKIKTAIKPIRVFRLFMAGIIVAVIVTAFQFTQTPSAKTQNTEKNTLVSEIDYQNAPIVGSPDAKYIVTLLFDYQCSHCQKIHFMLKEVVRQYKGGLAFVLRPTPLENSCNPYISSNKTAFKNSCELAKIGLAVWHVKPGAFSEFENWMFTYDTGNNWHPRSIEAAKAKAVELVGLEKFVLAMTDPWVELYIQNSVRMFGQTLHNGRGAIPKMIFNNTWVIPEPYNADDLVMILQKSLNVPKP